MNTSLNWKSSSRLLLLVLVLLPYFAISQVHNYYTFTIEGQTSICPDNTTIYMYTGPSASLEWTISGGTIVGSIIGASTEVIWHSASGSITASRTEESCWTDYNESPPYTICYYDHYSGTLNVEGSVPQYYVSGGGQVCAVNPAGVTIGLSGSQPNCTYQLYRNGTIAVQSPKNGTGAALLWTGLAIGGQYTVTPSCNAGICAGTTTSYATITEVPAPVGGSVVGSFSTCGLGGGGATFLHEGSGPGSIAFWQKNDGSGWAEISYTGEQLSDPNVITVTTHYRAAIQNSPCAITYSDYATVTIYPCAPVASIATELNYFSFRANWSASLAAGSYELDVATTNGFGASIVGTFTNINGTSKIVEGLVPGTTYYYRVRGVNASGSSSNSDPIQVNLPPITPPVATAASNVTSSSFVANWNPVAGVTTYLLDVSKTPSFNPRISGYDNLVVNGLSQVVSGLQDKTTYYYRIRSVISGYPSANSNTILGFDFDMNYIRSIDVLKPGVGESEIESLSSNRLITYQFFDGLGRPVQTVGVKQSPGNLDIVQPVAYDEFGREDVKYLPFTNGNDGWFKYDFRPVTDPNYATPANPQYHFYSSSPKVATDTHPYAKAILELSSLGRIVEQGSPGVVFQPDPTNGYTSSDWTIKKDYQTNGSGILMWSYTLPSPPDTLGMVNAGTTASPVHYGSNQLTKVRTKDEEFNEVIEYTDKNGRVVLKQVQAVPGTPIVNETNYACTYYVYDDFGQLVYVIPPEATKRLAAEFHNAPSNSKRTFMARWAYRYTYDHKRRMTIKALPGVKPVYMVYDNRDRLVLTQDGNQRAGATKYWSFTKYDEFNRPVLTGIRDTTAELTQSQMQDVVNEHLADVTATQGETYVGNAPGNIHGYTNKTYPIITGAGSEVDIQKYLTVTYYDTYAFRKLWPDSTSFHYQNESLTETMGSVTYNQEATANDRVKGLVTGSKVKVLDGGVTGGVTWLKSATYYDDKYRVIQTIGDNYKGGTDRVSSLMDFTGKVLETRQTHTENDITWTDLSGVIVQGNKLIRTVVGSGNTGAASKQVLLANMDGWVEYQVTEVVSSRRIGFNDSNPDTHPNNINYSFSMSGTTLSAMENSVTRQTVSGPLVPGEVLRIERVGTAIRWYRNGVNLNVTGYNPSNGSALIVDCTLQTAGGSTAGVRASFGGTTQVITRRFTYDHAGRLLKTYHKLNNGTEILMAQNEYNEIGQLVDKSLHSTNGTTFKQSTDMRYNIRGWLTTINNSQLAVNSTNDDTNDLFGMELGYESSIGTGNTGLYNGNISAMKWSRNMALGAVKDFAYNYTYDPMNRLMSATYKKDTANSWVNATNAFNESHYAYDLNGNILALKRRDAAGALMDDLVYDYGAGLTQSNRLMKVTDNGNDATGFKETGNSTTDDYVYDANGNMVWDRNKGGEERLENGSFDNGSSAWILSDPGSRFNFNNGKLDITPVGTSSLRQNLILQIQSPYVVIIDMVQTSANGYISLNVGGTTVHASATGTHVFSVTSSAARNFIITPSATWVGSINSVSVKGIAVITYNFLNLPEVVSNVTEQMRYVYDATGRKLHQNVYLQNVSAGTISLKKATEYSGAFMYENDTLQFINTEEGRVIMKTAIPEYQYHLKDHLGNVRLSFTSKDETIHETATYETASVNTEQSQFVRYQSAKRVYSSLFNRSNPGTQPGGGPGPPPDPDPDGPIHGYSQRLNGSTNEKYGVAKSISVMPGDVIQAEVST